MKFLKDFLFIFILISNMSYADNFMSLIDFYYSNKLTNPEKIYKNYFSEDITDYFNLASIYKEFGENEKAVEIYKKILEINNNEARAHFELAKIFYFLKKYEEAEKEINFFLNSNIINWEVYFWWGCILLKEKKFEEALEKFNEALKLDTRKVIIYIKIAELYIEKENIEEAISYYKKAIAADKTYTELNKKIARLYEKIKDFLNSYKYWVIMNNIDPKDEEANERISYYVANIEELKIKKEEYDKEIKQKREIYIPPDKKTMASAEIPIIKVGLLKEVDSISFKCGGDFEIRDEKGKFMFKGEKLREYNIDFDNTRAFLSFNGEKIYFKDRIFIMRQNKDSTTSIYNIRHGEGFYWSEKKDTTYRGDFMILVVNKKINLINLINIEEYLYGVVPSEIPTQWHKEALKAQAVAARTYTLKHLDQHRKEGFDLCATQHCAVYKGISGENKKTNEAVDETIGEVLIDKNEEFIDTFYSHCCGGHTQDVADVWGFKRIQSLKGVYDGEKNNWQFPLSPFYFEQWVRSLPDAYCKATGDNEISFRWIRYFNSESLTMYINKKEKVGKIKDIEPIKRAKYGALTEMRVIGEKGVKNFKFDPLRNVLGKIRSNIIKWEYSKDENGFIDEIFIYGAGWGHGVGMCQRGVKAMADKGKDYKEILLHYYPETRIIKNY
ncbi:MAG: SpoIID/LytB domain-containing protein [Candidatus Goldbacteria bacterium]|nr:SpoIID/LytB domain-containing protein [Candidatus Goldiibacteriota bacterium]